MREHNLLATDAMAAQRLLEALIHKCLHSWASNPEGPAAPFTRKATRQMVWESIESKTTW